MPAHIDVHGIAHGCIHKAQVSGKNEGVIHNLLWPPGQSVDDFIDKDKFSVQYMSIVNVESHLQHVGCSALLAKLDLSDSFHHTHVRPEDWELLGSTWPNS